MDEIEWGDDEHERRAEETKRLARILKIISLIQNGPRRWTRGRLAAELGYSQRQIDNDLRIIRHGLCYELGHAPEGYFFTRAPELRAIRYTPSEALALLGALQLAQGSGALDAASLAAALARTEEALPGAYLDLARALRRTLSAPTERQRHRAEMLRLTQAAYAERRCLEVLYESATREEPIERIWRPYVVEMRDGLWLVTAHDSLQDDVRYFRVDRMLRARLLEERYAIPDNFDAAAYRGAGFGILRDLASEPVDVALRFTAAEGRRVRDDTFHPSQREERQEDGSWLVRFHMGITPEFVRWIFRWGTGCEVLAPAELRRAVAEQARRIAQVNKGDE